MTQRPNSRQPIPPDAKRVFVGYIFDVYQWNQKLFDGTTAVFEKVKRPDTAYVIPVTASGKLVLAAQEQPGAVPTTGLVGGRIEDGESPEQAARRELLEEAGLITSDLELWVSFQFLPKIDWAIYIFIARDFHESSRHLDGGEKIDLTEVTFDDFIRLVADESFGDLEVALRILRMTAESGARENARQFVLGK